MNDDSSVLYTPGDSAAASTGSPSMDAFAQLQQQLSELRTETQHLRADIQTAQSDAKKAASEATTSALKTSLQALAVFIGLFTFVSLEFQLTQLVSGILSATGLTLIFLGGFGFFLLALNLMLKKRKDNSKHARLWLFVITAVLIVGGAVLVGLDSGRKPYTEQQREEIKSIMDERAVEWNTQGDEIRLLREDVKKLQIDNATLRQCVREGIKDCHTP